MLTTTLHDVQSKITSEPVGYKQLETLHWCEIATRYHSCSMAYHVCMRTVNAYTLPRIDKPGRSLVQIQKKLLQYCAFDCSRDSALGQTQSLTIYVFLFGNGKYNLKFPSLTVGDR